MHVYYTKSRENRPKGTGLLPKQGVECVRKSHHVRIFVQACESNAKGDSSLELLYTGFETCFGWNPRKVLVFYTPKTSALQEPTSVKGGIETVGFMIGHLSWA